jgi:hypothetical protein
VICLAHLVRKANGPVPFQTFLESYRRIRPGAEHELVLLLKGFDSEEDAQGIISDTEDLVSRSLHVPDEGFDVGSYLSAARQLEYASFCFLNSFSVIQSEDWLEKMSAALNDDVALVGASGSSTSHYSLLTSDVGFGPYRGIFGSRPTHQAALKIAREREGDFRGPLRRAAAASTMLPSFVRYFDRFPSYHVRTNAFLIRADVLKAVGAWRFERKIDAWRFESGRQCLLRQVEAMGFRAAVVGVDGEAYEKQAWHESNTFWQSRQENLLVADNQSRDYKDGDHSRKLFLSLLAWGENARPA